MPLATTLRSLTPGLLLVAVATAVAYAVNGLVPLLSALLVAILLGVLLRNARLIPAAAEPGIAFAAKKLLRAGVVLLGFQLSVPAILELGWGVVGVILAVVTVTVLGTLAAGRLLGLSREQSLLIATGTSICGASAVAAMAAVLQPAGEKGAGDAESEGAHGMAASKDAEAQRVDEAAATAVATVTLYGTLALGLVVALAGPLGLDARQAGVWAGASIHEVGQVVAAGGLLGAESLDTAVLTKLGRVLLLAPLVVIVGTVLARQARAAAGRAAGTTAAGTTTKRPPLMPLFVAGFLVAVVVRSLLGLPDAHWLPSTVKVLATLLLTAAMVGMGAGVNIATLVRRGGPMLALAGIASLLVGSTGLVGVLLLV